MDRGILDSGFAPGTISRLCKHIKSCQSNESMSMAASSGGKVSSY